METRTKKRRKNAIERYFVPFGLRQLCDIILLLSAIAILVGMLVYKQSQIVLPIALGAFAIGALLAAFRAVRVMISGVNKRSPEYKAALVNLIIMAALALLAIIGIIICIVEMM